MGPTGVLDVRACAIARFPVSVNASVNVPRKVTSLLATRRRFRLAALTAGVFGLAAICTVVATQQIQDRVGMEHPLTAPLVVSAGFGLGVLASRVARALGR